MTFGDPDFFNGVHHARRVVAALHGAFPDVTFDCTVKVEHVLRHAELWPELAASGCLFVVSAFESVDDDDPHDPRQGPHRARRDARDRHPARRRHRAAPHLAPVHAVVHARPASAASSSSSPTHDLIGNVDPVQYSIRLLVPEGSLLLGHIPDLGPWDPVRLGYEWTSPLDELQREFAAVVEARADDPVGDVFNALRALVDLPAGRRPARRGGTPAERVVVLLRRADDRAAAHRLTARRPGDPWSEPAARR